MARVFLVEDDVGLAHECARLLTLNGYEVCMCSDFANAVPEALAANADCAIVDLRLPGADGLAICRELRRGSQLPIIVLTSSDSEFDEVMSMNLGADDYLTKPYSPAVLLARLSAVLRRANPQLASTLKAHGLVLDLAKSELSFGAAATTLTRNELRILAALMRANGSVVSRADLMYELWQSDEFVDDNTLTVNVNRLRKSLERVGAPAGLIATHRGQGYAL